MGDGPLDDLADPVDALILLLGRLAQFAIGGILFADPLFMAVVMVWYVDPAKTTSVPIDVDRPHRT